MILATLINKGGISKTTTAISLAHGLVMHKKKVLLVDLDVQPSASLSLGFNRSELQPSVFDILVNDCPAEDAIKETSVTNFHLIPGSVELANFDLCAANQDNREALLKDALAPLRKKYDTIILDCGPSISQLTVNAMHCCDKFIVPIRPSYLEAEGLASFLDTVERVRGGIGEVGDMLGILLTMTDYRSNFQREVADMLRKEFKGAVFKTEIPMNIRVAEASSHAKTIFQYDPLCAGAVAYQDLTKEVIQRLKKGKTKWRS